MHDSNTYKKSREQSAVVYWIHYLDQTDPKNEGYIGISTQLSTRIKSHISRNPHMKHRIDNGAVVTVLHEVSTLSDAAKFEQEYRPEDNIGWNLIKGGDIPPSRKNKVSPKVLLKGEERTEKQKLGAKKQSEKMKGRTAWNLGKKGLQTAWNKGIKKEKHPCLVCGKYVDIQNMSRWHGEKCKGL